MSSEACARAIGNITLVVSARFLVSRLEFVRYHGADVDRWSVVGLCRAAVPLGHLISSRRLWDTGIWIASERSPCKVLEPSDIAVRRILVESQLRF